MTAVASTAVALTAACSPAGEVIDSVDEPAWDRRVTPPSDVRAADRRAACAYQAGALPAETQGESHPTGDDIPIDHIVILMQENRSFDHYFQTLPAYGQPDVDVAPVTYSNPNGRGQTVRPHHAKLPCSASTNHSWAGSHQQADGGKMDGFIVASEGKSEKGEPEDTLQGERALEYYDATDLPFYFNLVNEFALADHYHASVLGPTWPNRMYLYAASSYGRISNVEFQPTHTIFEYMEKRGVDYKLYFSDSGGLGDYLRALVPHPADHIRDISDYFADAKDGSLPSVAFVNATFAAKMLTSTWEHAPHLVTMGERFVAEVVAALEASPEWPRSALFLTYDEHGGLYDHVVPPPACAPDGLLPLLGAKDPPAGFNQYGIRVPMVVVSPYAKPHYVGHHVYDHTSLLRFIEARFTIGALSARDANAEAPWDMLDFESPPKLLDPQRISLPPVDVSALLACMRKFPDN